MDQHVIAENLAVVDAHFHSEAANEIDRAVGLYTDDIVWESPARGLVFHGRQAAAENYRAMFGAMENVQVTPLRRFATTDRVVDDSIATFTHVGDGVINAPLPVGANVELRLVHIFEMLDRKIARELVYEIWRPAATRAAQPAADPTPERLMQLGLGFWHSKTLLSAVELGVFTELAKGPLGGKALAHRLGLHPRSHRDFFDALVAMGVLHRDRDLYTNTAETDFLLDRAKPSYMGGILEMANARLYPFWGTLSDGLRTGQPQNEIKQGGNFFDVLYSDPERLRGFLQAMSALSTGTSKAIARSSRGSVTTPSSTSAPRKARRQCRSLWHIRTSAAAATTCLRSARFSRTTCGRSDSAIGCASTPAASSAIRCRRPTCC
jgi:ketosteroid isomerase-like protein